VSRAVHISCRIRDWPSGHGRRGKNVIRVAICESLIGGTRFHGRKSSAIYQITMDRESQRWRQCSRAAPIDSLLIFYIMSCVALYRGTTSSENPAFPSLRGLSPKESKPVRKLIMSNECWRLSEVGSSSHCERSEAISTANLSEKEGLLRRGVYPAIGGAPRNDY
jgi:hypothetical protein